MNTNDIYENVQTRGIGGVLIMILNQKCARGLDQAIDDGPETLEVSKNLHNSRL